MYHRKLIYILKLKSFVLGPKSCREQGDNIRVIFTLSIFANSVFQINDLSCPSRSNSWCCGVLRASPLSRVGMTSGATGLIAPVCKPNFALYYLGVYMSQRMAFCGICSSGKEKSVILLYFHRTL